MSTDVKTDWFSELNLVKDKDKIIAWGMKTFPQFAKNQNMMAQLWWTIHEGKVLPELKTFTTVEELRKKLKEFADRGEVTDEKGKPKRVWGNIEVLVVGPLGDGRPYFGCERCTRGIDKNIGVCVNDDPKNGHPGEQIEGKMIAFQNWSAGDTTDEVIIAFSPNNKQSPTNIQGRVLSLSGSMNIRDGRFTVWEIFANKSAAYLGGSGAEEKVILAPTIKEPIVEDIPEEVIIDDTKIVETVPEAAESEFIDEAFFAEEEFGDESVEVGSELRDLIPDYDGLVKTFMKSLDKHVMTKQVPLENIIKFLEIQPQLRELPNKSELAIRFLTYMKDVKKIIVIKSVGGKELLARA
jgi:hypothetical protein